MFSRSAGSAALSQLDLEQEIQLFSGPIGGAVNAQMDSLSERLLLAVVIFESRFSLSTSAGRETTSVADPCLFGMDPDQRMTDPDADLDPALFIIDLQDANKKLI